MVYFLARAKWKMAFTDVIVDSNVLASGGEPRQATINDEQWQALKGTASSGGWMRTYKSERVDEISVRDMVGAATLLAIDIALAAVATILVFYIPG